MTKDLPGNLHQSYDCALQPEQKRAKISDGFYANWLPMKPTTEVSHDDASHSTRSHMQPSMPAINAQAQISFLDLLKNSQQRLPRRPVPTNVADMMLDASPVGSLHREKGTDMAKKESVAKTRYMDKQKVASFLMAAG